MSIWYPLALTAIAVAAWTRAMLGSRYDEPFFVMVGLMVFCVSIGLWIGWALS